MAKKRTQIINNASALEIRQNAARAIYEETVSNSIQNDAWLSQQPAALQKFLGGDNSKGEYTLGVAMFNREMGNVISRSSHVMAALEYFSPYDTKRFPSPFKHNAIIDKVYGELGRKDSNGNSHIQTLIGGKGTDVSLQWENMPGYQSHQTAKQAMEAIQNAKQHGVVAWDLETTAGKNLGEENYAANITEFSFARAGNDGKVKDTWQSIVGATQKEFDEYMKVVEKFRYGAKNDLSHEELVTGQRLALMGHSKTSVEFKDGLFNYSSFAGAEDIRNLDWADMEAGARELFRIGEEQRAAGLIQGYGGYRMYAWENALLGGVGAIMKDGATALGYNSRTFDMNRLNQLVSSGKLSSGAMQALRDIGYNGTLSFNNHLDIMPIMREKFSKDSYTTEDYRYMQQHGLTEFQQETLVRKLTSKSKALGGEDFYHGKPAHMAMTDVKALVALADKTVLSNDASVAAKYAYNTSNSMAIEGGKGQLFMAKQHVNADRYNLMVAMEDELTGQLRFGDKYALGKDGEVEEQLFGQSGFQRGVTYEVESLSEKKMSDEFKTLMGKLYPQMALDNLTVMKVRAFAPGANTVRSQSAMYYIGYKDDIEHAMMDNTLYIGDKDVNGNVDPSKVSERTKKELAMFTQAGQGPSSVVVDSQADVNKVIHRGGEMAQEDAAARMTRYKSYNHDAKLIHLMEAIQEQVDQSAGSKTWSAVENEFWNNSVKISNALISGQKIDTSSTEFINSYNNYLGYTNQKTGVQGMLYSETLSSQRARLGKDGKGWAFQNYDIIKAALAKVEPISDPNERKFAYQQIMQGIEDYAIANGGYGNIGYKSSPAFGYEYTNRFDVNLRGFKGITENKVITINMDSYGSSVANQVIRAANLGPVKDFNDSAKSRLLNDLQTFMRKNGYLGKQTQNFVEHGDSLALAGNKFLASLTDARAQNADIGHLIDPETGLMRGLSRITLDTPKNFGIQKDIASLVNEIASNLPRYHATFGTDPNKIHENAKDAADKVSKILFQKEDVAELKKAGYTDKEISNLSKIRGIVRGDTKEYLTSLFDTIGNLGGTIHWDDRTRRVSATLEGQSFNLELPTGVFRGGQYQTKIGRSIVSVPLGIYDMRRFGEKKANLQYASLIKKAVAENQGLLNWHARQAKQDKQGAVHIQKFLSDFNRTIREAPVVKDFHETQRANQFLSEYWDLFANIDSIGLTEEDFKRMDELAGRDKVYENGKFIGYSSEEKTNVKLMRKLASGDIRLIGENGQPKMEYMNAMMDNIDIIFDRFGSKYSDGSEVRKMMNDFRFDTAKMADRLRAYIDNEYGDPFLQYGNTKRGPAGIEDSARINMSRINDMINTGGPDYDALKGIEAGAGLTSESRYKWARYADGMTDAQGKELEFNTRVRANMIHMNRAGLAATMNYGLQQLINNGEKIDNSVHSLISTMMAEEGAGFMHGQVFDRIMNARYSTQKIALDKLVQSGGQTLNDIRQKYHSIPKFEFRMNANGSFDINFKYDTGMFVMRDDVIASVEGQGTKPSKIAAKYDGIFNFGFFDAENQLVSEEQINNILRNDQNFLSKLNATSESQRAQAVMDYLENERGFASSFFIQTSAANPLVKVAEFSEKGMTRGLIAGTGELNHDIRAVMETLGFSGSNLNFKDKDGRRRTLQSVGALEIDVIDSLKNGGNLLDTKFGVEAKGRYERITGTELTEAKLRKILSDNNFGSAESFRKAIMEERYTPSRVVSKIFNELGITATDENWHFITNHYANIKKHGDMSSYRYLTDEWIKRDGEEKAKKHIAKYLLGVDEADADKYIGGSNNSLFLRNGVKLKDLDYSGLEDIYRDTGIIDKNTGEYTTKISKQFLLGNQLIKAQYEKITGEVSQVGKYWDREKISDDAVRLNQRAITIAKNIRYSDEVIENARKFLEKRGDGGNEIYEKYLAGAERGAAVNIGAIDQIKRNIFNRAAGPIGSEKIMGYMDIDGSGDLKVGIDDAALGKMIREEHIAGGDIEQGSKIMKSLMKNVNSTMGITTVNREGAVNLYRASMAVAAESFQTGQVSLEGMKKLGFKVKGIDELDFGDTGPDSIFGENILVDLKTDTFGDRLYDGDESKRYLALSYSPGQQDADVFTAPQKQVEGLVREIQQYEGNASSAGFRGDEERIHGFEKVMNKVQSTRDAINSAYFGKKGIMAQSMYAHMHDGSRNTAMGIELYGIETKNKNVQINDLVSQFGSRIDKLEINGHNLVEEAARGDNAIQFSYTILSKERMHDIYNKNFGEIQKSLEEQGINADFLKGVQQETFEEVMTKGTHGISYREPMQYFGSITQRQIFFSDIAKNNEAIGNFTSAIMRKEDYDSDAVGNAIHKEQAALRINGGKAVNIEVDSAMYNVLNRTKGVSVELLDKGASERFESYNASQYYLGAGEAQRYRKLIDWSQELNSGNVLEPFDNIDKYDIVPLGNRNTVFTKQDTLENFKALRDEYSSVSAKLYNRSNDFFQISGEERRARMVEYHDELLQAGKKDEAEKVKKAVQFSILDKTLKADITSRTAQPYGAGIVNYYTQTYLNISNEIFDNEEARKALRAQSGRFSDIGKLSTQISLTTTALQEGYLSPKNNTSEISTKALTDAFNSAFRLADDASEEERKEVRDNLFNTVYGVLSERMDKEMAAAPSEQVVRKEMSKGLIGTKYTDEQLKAYTYEAVSNYTDFLVNLRNNGNSISSFGMASRSNSKYKGTEEVGFTPNSKRVDNQMMGVITNMFSDMNVGDSITRRSPFTGPESSPSIPDEAVSDMQEQGQRIARAKGMQKSMTEAAQEALGKLGKGHGLFGAAVGIAGGLMVAGFANDPSGGQHKRPPTAEGAAFGNTPMPNASQPEPALTQAQDGYSYISANAMPLTDSNLNVLRGGPNSSYVINISGNSPQGQQAAVNAIQNSIGGNVPQNSSINVAINNNMQDTLSQWQVNRMVQTAVGL